MRSTVLLLVATLALPLRACGPDVGAPLAGQSPATSSPARSAPATGGSGEDPDSAPPAATEGGQAPTSSDGSATLQEGPSASDSGSTTDDLGGIGANGRAYLRGDHPSLIVEVDVQEGVEPGQAALEHLRNTIARHADKPGGIHLTGGNRFSSDRREWTRDDLRAVAQRHRRHYSDDGTAVLYVLYVRGGFHEDGEETGAVGVTYNASEIALFPDRWSGLGGLVGAGRDIERAVLVHEFGHSLGLVNLTYRSELDHEDPDHPGHSSNRRSVMYWAVETTLVGQVFEGPPPDEFDEADLADIEGLRTGRY